MAKANVKVKSKFSPKQVRARTRQKSAAAFRRGTKNNVAKAKRSSKG